MPKTNELNKESSLNPTQLLKLLHEIHIDFMQHTISLEDLCDHLLKILLQCTRSNYGYIGSVHDDGKQKYLKSYSTTEVLNNEVSKKNHVENFIPSPKKSISQNSFFHSVIKSGEPIINNEISKQEENIGIPFDHPTITNFMSFAIKFEGKVIGVLGIANR
ncbi:MAG: GAF domain-containing protein, partial [Cyclobacteriaceae bacterium]|nr:GAF domain-containing protein [Cyclobacteriaceae bacterium]